MGHSIATFDGKFDGTFDGNLRKREVVAVLVQQLTRLGLAENERVYFTGQEQA